MPESRLRCCKQEKRCSLCKEQDYQSRDFLSGAAITPSDNQSMPYIVMCDCPCRWFIVACLKLFAGVACTVIG